MNRILKDLRPKAVCGAVSAILLVASSLNAFADNSAGGESGVAAHERLMRQSQYPSATQCATCHPEQFREWSASPHAYAQLSPVFNAMHAKLVKDTNGTLGDFCIRCHTPVGMELGEPIVAPNSSRDPVALEGVTCVSCHRRILPAGKNSSRNGIISGDIFHPVYGPKGNEELRRVIESGEFEVNTDRSKTGRDIHLDAVVNPQISTPAFCGNCHDVHNANGFRLEEAFSDFKSSPAAAKKITCQDCHMGKEPGKPSGYEFVPVALVGGNPTRPRKHANHRFIGPDYSIVHPALFPHNPAAKRFATLDEWLTFDVAAGWGTDDFEDTVDGGVQFPPRWSDAADRYEARKLIDANLELLREASDQRLQLLRTGYLLDDPKIRRNEANEIVFAVDVRNGIEGHSVPTGFDAERPVYLRVTMRDSSGAVVFRSGDLDPNGDLRDEHSAYVHSGQLERDRYLFNLQSQFLVELNRGSERGQILNTNYSVSPLPFLRPPTNASFLLGRAAGTRKHRQVIPPLRSRTAEYRVQAEELAGHSGPYCAEVELVAGMVPVNLINGIQEVGFDYGMSPRALADAVVAGHQVLWKKALRIDSVSGTSSSVEGCRNE